MPIFLDAHYGAELPVATIRTFLRGARSAARDSYGVMPLDLFCGDDGRVFCVVSAPDEAAVRQRHAAEGVVCRRVRRVQSLAGSGEELSPEEKAVVRQMITAEKEPSAPPGAAANGEWLRQVG